MSRKQLAARISYNLFVMSSGEKLFCDYDFSHRQTLEVSVETGYWFLLTSVLISSSVICWNHSEWRLIGKVYAAPLVITAAFKHNYQKDVSVESVLSKQQHFDIMFSFPVTDHVLHATVSCVCDAQPGGLHPLLPERSAGQLSGGLSAGETNWTLTHALCSSISVDEKMSILTSHLFGLSTFSSLKTFPISLWLDLYIF